MLKETFIKLAKSYSTDQQLVEKFWNEIETRYSNKKRYYHNLTHLENVLIFLEEVKDQIKEWDTILFALFYHDIVYNTLKSNNEEKSAVFAEQKMKMLLVPETITQKCVAIILATKRHQQNPDSDTNFLTDTDLSVLGMDWEIYAAYFRAIRKEYGIYPDIVYNPGRAKVLQHFLQMNRIFKTDYFFNRFEQQAKQNMQRELEQLF